ncbi:LysR family transcriptional regulator [Psychromonas sp. Urea-02u-13]|uniref:LysR family transcriptional regulator n=1 Tax=Psychromonas sp. Urea-02u-13 TaxID=2058326 RepID=UPI002FCDA472
MSVYELQGYSVAAKKLGKGRTTVRELIMTLEERLDLLLFEIEGRKVKATASADKLYPHARLLQAQLMSFSGLTNSLHEGQESRVSIDYDVTLPAEFMVSLTALLHKKFPYIQLSWKETSWQSGVDAVSKNESQIAFLTNKKGDSAAPLIETFFLGWNDFGIFAGKNSPLQDLNNLGKIEFRNIVQLIPKSMLEEGINGYTRFANIYITVSNNDDVCRLLAQLGWAMLPHCDVRQYVERGDIKQIYPDFMLNELKVSMVAYYRPEINRGPAMTYLLSLLPQLSKQYFT